LTVIGHRQFPHGPGTAQAAPVSCRRQRQHLAGYASCSMGGPASGTTIATGRRAAARARDRAGLL